MVAFVCFAVFTHTATPSFVAEKIHTNSIGMDTDWSSRSVLKKCIRFAGICP